MPLELPEDAVVVGQIDIALVLKSDGDVGTEFGYDGISREGAIGHLTTVIDRLREEARLSWDTCPDCGEPWSDHDFEGEDEDDEEDEDELYEG